MSRTFPLLLNGDHKILRNESCSGYMDVLGIWNTGFYCPQTDSKSVVYCCGTETFKYCCTKGSSAEESYFTQNSTISIRTPIIIGVIIGFVMMISFLILTMCLLCPCCLFYKKRSTHLPPGLYRMHCGTSSTTSGLVSLNSPSNSIENAPVENNNLWTMQANANYYRNVNLPNGSSHVSSQFSPRRFTQQNCQISTSSIQSTQRNQSYSSNRFWNSTDAESYCSDLLNSSSVCYSNYRPTHITATSSSDTYSQNSNNSRTYSSPYCNLFYRLSQTTNPILHLGHGLGEIRSTPAPDNTNFSSASSTNYNISGNQFRTTRTLRAASDTGGSIDVDGRWTEHVNGSSVALSSARNNRFTSEQRMDQIHTQPTQQNPKLELTRNQPMISSSGRSGSSECHQINRNFDILPADTSPSVRKDVLSLTVADLKL